MDERTVTMDRVSLEEIWSQAHIAKELSCMGDTDIINRLERPLDKSIPLRERLEGGCYDYANLCKRASSLFMAINCCLEKIQLISNVLAKDELRGRGVSEE